MWKKKKTKKQSKESAELNEVQLDAVNGGLIAQDPDGYWRAVAKDGSVYKEKHRTKFSAQSHAMSIFRSPDEISWDDVKRRQRENR